jgi:hypothetical protein
MEIAMFYFRSPRTANEKRFYEQTVYNEVGILVKVRSRRKQRHLPSSWDDMPRQRMRNWKEYRQTQ